MAIKRIDDTRKITGIKAEADTYAEALAFLPHLDPGDQIRVGSVLYCKTSIKTLLKAQEGTGIAATAPGVTDDISKGHIAGDMIYDTATNLLHICTDNSVGAAVWDTAPAAFV